mgnify:CR=1 FL=1
MSLCGFVSALHFQLFTFYFLLDLHFRTALLVNEIEGLTDKSELKVLIEKLPIGDVNYLRNTINNPPFGVDTKTPLECTYCQADFNTDLPLEASFFFPKDQKKNQTQA